jgi:mRNA interferase RelE/StbE
MGRYKVVFRKSVAQDIRRVPNRDVQRILAAIHSLSEEARPPGVEKLSGQEKYRVRQGNYRMIYEIKDDEVTVVVVKVGHQRDVYRHSQRGAAAAAKKPRC